MKTFLIWFVPPLIGAVIGFITNALAIKMLFRPLEEKRAFGIRIPFTPGILPKQRGKLAQSIGRMVERELLTPDIIKQRLEREETRSAVKKNVSLFTETLLAKPLNSFPLLEKNSSLARFLNTAAKGFLQSPAFDALFESLWDALVSSLAADAPEEKGKSIRGIIGEEYTIKLNAAFQNAAIKRLETDGLYIAGRAASMLYRSFPQITEACAKFLKRAEIRRVLETQGRVFLSNAIGKLSAFQRFFVFTAQYDQTLSEKMPEIIEDLVGQLERILTDQQNQKQIFDFFTDSTAAFLCSKENSKRIAAAVSDFLSPYLDKPLNELFFLNDPENSHELGQKIAASLKNYGNNFLNKKDEENQEKKTAFMQSIEKMLEKHNDWTLGTIFTLTADKKELLDSFIAEKLLSLADAQIENVLRSVSIQSLVAERVNQLEMIRVERIILDIMANQLKWINVFGAVIGAIIGVFQSLFSYFYR